MPHSPHLPRELGPSASRSVAGGGNDGPRVTAELGVRSLSADAQPLLDRAIEGLGRAVEDGSVDEFELFVTGETFVPGSAAARTAVGRDLSRRVADIRDWATRTGASVDPYFEPDDVDCRFTDEQYTCVRFPTLSLVEYHDGELAFVAPARVDGDLVDVLDRVAALATPKSERVAVPSE